MPHPFSIVSVREDGSNTVTEQDRSRWVRDISMFLHDLHIAAPLNGEGRLQALIECGTATTPSTPPALTTSSSEGRLRRELAVLRAENQALRTHLADLETRACEPSPDPAPAAS